MNERILELAKQAGLTTTTNTDVCFFLEKFAELIVQECMKIALDERVPDEEIDKSDDIEDRCYLSGNNGGIVDAVVAIKKHFGDEE
jgi:hypothetical protein